jgi:integrase
MSVTLGAVWSGVARPWMVSQRRSPKTLVSYEESLAVWCRSTGDPAISEVNGSHVAKFHCELVQLRPKRGESVSDFTRRKHLRQVRSLFRFCLPASDDCPVALGCLVALPSLGKVRAVAELRVVWSPADIVALCAAASQMTTPRWCWAVPLWWRSLLAFAYCTGYRRQTLLGLRWRHVDGDVVLPPAGICKRGSSVRHFLNEDGLLALRLASVFRDEDPNSLVWDWPHGVRHFDRQLRRLCELAGFPAERVTGIHAARRCHATQLGLISGDAARASLGHASADTTVKHYLGSEVVRVAVSRLPRVLGGGE